MRGVHPQSYMTHQPRGHVTNQKHYISTFTRPIDPRLSRILVILWLLHCLRGSKLADPSKILFLSFFVKVYYIKFYRKRRDATEGLPLLKIEAKIPTRTEGLEMNKIVTNSEIHLHH